VADGSSTTGADRPDVKTPLTDVERVPEGGSWLFTVRQHGTDEEYVLVRCDDERGPVRAFRNVCTHEPQPFDRANGRGAAMRDGELICPRHGSSFDTCSGHCDNGDAPGTTLPALAVTVEGGTVYLTDDRATFRHDGPKEEGDDMPGSTSHLGF
jgi:nitrite reductase/ring-hydroxylating ferredoxin subunit